MKTSPEREQFRQICRMHGCRCTNQRIAVYEFICGNRTHPAVDQIWQAVQEKMPSITRESVFRILTEFAAWGLVYRMDKIVNARFDGFTLEHGHFICRECGTIFDFSLPEALPRPADSCGFQAEHAELRISGLCAECAAKHAKE